MRLILAFFFFFSSAAFASDWEITFFGQQPTSGQFISSPSSHCSSIAGMPASGITDGRTYTDVQFLGYFDAQGHPTSDPLRVSVARCSFKHPWYMSPWDAAYSLKCPSGSTFDIATGSCLKPNLCEATQGQTTTHEHKLSDAVGAPRSDPPGTVCSNSCQYVFDHNVVNVYAYKGGNPPGIFGAYTYRGNGQECNGDTLKSPGSDSGATTNPDETPPPTDGDKCPEGYIWNGTFCSKADDPPKPCYPDAPPGSLGACDDGKDPEEPGDGDDKPGDGDDNPGDGDGSGDGDGKGDGEGDGDGEGKGDGEGDTPDKPCDPAKDPNKCGQSSVGGEACGVLESCTGDAIQCAIFRQEKAQRCADEEFRKIDQKAVADLKKEIEAEHQGEQYQPITATAENTFALDSMLDTSSRFSNSCPVLPDWHIPWIEGSDVVIRLTFVQDFCQYLHWFGYLVVAFAMFRAAEIIAEGMN